MPDHVKKRFVILQIFSFKIDHCAGNRNSSNYSENVMFKRGVQSMHWRFFMRESAASKLSINQEANRISSPKCLGCLCAEQTLKTTQRKKGCVLIWLAEFKSSETVSVKNAKWILISCNMSNWY